MQEILGREIQEGEADFKKRFSGVRFSREMYKAEKELERKKEIALNIRLKCINHAEEEKAQPKKSSVLAASWEQMKENACGIDCL